MKLRLAVAAVALAIPAVVATSQLGGSSSSATPRWVRHTEQYQGGISNGVRESLAVQSAATHAPRGPITSGTTFSGVHNVQMNDDSYPAVPQNEQSVAYDVSNPMIAVAGSNDYVSGGTAVMRTSDGGRHWQTTRVVPWFSGTHDVCSGGDPSVAYSARDHAFYLGQLCFFRTMPGSEVQVYKSIDNGATWTPGRLAALPATNFDASTGTIDDSVFNDKDYITVDNNPSSPHFGRLYVTWTRFHMQPSGFSDTCPIKLAYTDNVPTNDPQSAVFHHSDVVPDNIGGNGLGETANQYSVPVVSSDGTLNVAYVLEECNTSIDHGLRYQRSTDGGNTFLAAAVHVNHGMQWVDNPNPADLLPNGAFRAPNTIALAVSPTTHTMAFIYTNYIRGRANGDIDVSLSHDGGTTWSEPILVSVNANGRTAPNNQFFPWIAVDENGRFQAMWLDRRDDPANHFITTYQATSTDDGQTWHNFRIGASLWNPDESFFTSGAFIGDYSGLAASAKVVYPVWTDGSHNSFFTTGFGETDDFTNVEISG
jgi:hypothetical protein